MVIAIQQAGAIRHADTTPSIWARPCGHKLSTNSVCYACTGMLAQVQQHDCLATAATPLQQLGLPPDAADLRQRRLHVAFARWGGSGRSPPDVVLAQTHAQTTQTTPKHCAASMLADQGLQSSRAQALCPFVAFGLFASTTQTEHSRQSHAHSRPRCHSASSASWFMMLACAASLLTSCKNTYGNCAMHGHCPRQYIQASEESALWLASKRYRTV